jgi:type VI secretion system secreted protein VgrG
MPQIQTARAVEFITPLGDDVLLFHQMTATETLGRLFRFDLELLSKDPDIKFEDLLGQNVTVRLELPPDKARYFNGYVSRFTLSGSLGDLSVFRAAVRPWLWFLTRTADCRIFQEMTVPDIIKQVFRDHGFTDFEEALGGAYRTWPYCVQYRETDFNFVSRLMEQEGIYYYFKHEKDKHLMVLSDDIGSHEAYPGYEKLPFYPPDEHKRREEQHIHQWTVSQEVQPGVYALNDFDFERPKADLNVKQAIPRDHARASLEIFDYPGEYLQIGDGEAYVRARIEELHAEYEQARGQSNARGLCAGSLFELTRFPRQDQNREYLVTSAIHEIESDAYTSGADTPDEEIYTCSFTALDSKQPFRPERITPKPLVQGPQTATVTGPAGEEIHADKYGRVKIQFHWDRYGKKDENSSCWVRVSHPTAGQGWGAVQIPRIGQEVIVDFLEGDPDHPIITGRVYNANQMPPFELPAGGMISGMKSNSTPGGGGYNEISMNDAKGEEAVTVHAQHDMTTTVENDRAATIVGGNDTLAVQAGTRSVTVKGDTSLTVEAGDRTVNVTGNYQLDTTSEIKIQAPDKITLTCGGSSIKMEPGKITISAGSGGGITLDENALMTSSVGSEVRLDDNATLTDAAEAKPDAPTSTLSEGGSET